MFVGETVAYQSISALACYCWVPAPSIISFIKSHNILVFQFINIINC